MNPSFAHFISIVSKFLLTGLVVLCCVKNVSAFPIAADTPTSSRVDALRYIESMASLKQSTVWPGVYPDLYWENVKEVVSNPFNLYEGTNTNFCGYAALSYLLLRDDPLQYAKFMFQLYTTGKANWGKIMFRPSEPVKQIAGRLKFKGSLDIHPADQIWFLCLADHFKGYLNLFNHHFDPGDENTFWAAVNYSKFNRMVREMSVYHVSARGSDLAKPWINDLYGYISREMQNGVTILYLNNTVLHKKNHNRVRTAIPTHYVILLDCHRTPEGLISITYWDYGFRSLREVAPSFFKKIIFGVSHCTKETTHD